MAELLVIGFENPFDADRVLTEMSRLKKEHLIDLEDAVVVVRAPDGQVNIKQSVNLVGLGAAQGGLSGALWGGLIGLLFLNPLAGMAVGAAAGAGSGALTGNMIDYGIDDGFIKQTAETLRPDTSALFLLVRKAQPEKVLAELKGYSGRILRSSLSPEQEAKLQSAIQSGAVPPLGAPTAARPTTGAPAPQGGATTV